MLNPEVTTSSNGKYEWLSSFKWAIPPREVEDPSVSSEDQIVIAGRFGVGKKTLVNTLCGWNAITTMVESVAQYGRLTVVEMPNDGGRWNDFAGQFSGAQIVVYVIDAAAVISELDLAWVARLRTLQVPVIVAANKLDAVDKKTVKSQINTLRERLGVPVLPVTTSDVLSVHRVFLPALLKACPNAAETLGSEIGGIRVRVAWQMTLRAAFSSALISLESESAPDVATLVGLHMRLMRRIGMLYGYRAVGGHGRELLLTTVLRFAFRYALRLAGRYPQVRGWVVSGTLAMFTTLLIGRAAAIYYSVSLPNWIRWF